MIETIKRLIGWLPILWEDRDFDYAYILIILKYKLTRTRKCIVKNNIIENIEGLEEQIKKCEETLDRLIEDNYGMHSKTTFESIERANREREEDLDLLFKDLRQNITSWWD